MTKQLYSADVLADFGAEELAKVGTVLWLPSGDRNLSVSQALDVIRERGTELAFRDLIVLPDDGSIVDRVRDSHRDGHPESAIAILFGWDGYPSAIVQVD